jgi:hypothetical protein
VGLKTRNLIAKSENDREALVVQLLLPATGLHGQYCCPVVCKRCFLLPLVSKVPRKLLMVATMIVACHRLLFGSVVCWDDTPKKPDADKGREDGDAAA